VAVMGWHFRCLQWKEARQTAKKAVQKGRRKEGGPAQQAATDQVDQVYQDARRRPHRRPTIAEEIRLEEETNQSREPAGKWDQERGPCETDDITRADSGGWVAQPVWGEGQRAVTK
jgi:hypothetical protein